MNEFWNTKRVKPRKIHRCDICGKIIAIGEHCIYESGKFDGDFQSFYLCISCYELKEHYCHENRDHVNYYGWNADDIIEDIRERICTECGIRKECTGYEKVLIDEVYPILGDALKCYLGCEVVAATMTDVYREEEQKRWIGL